MSDERPTMTRQAAQTDINRMYAMKGLTREEWSDGFDWLSRTDITLHSIYEFHRKLWLKSLSRLTGLPLT